MAERARRGVPTYDYRVVGVDVLPGTEILEILAEYDVLGDEARECVEMVRENADPPYDRIEIQRRERVPLSEWETEPSC